jgi:hypothetical protein
VKDKIYAIGGGVGRDFLNRITIAEIDPTTGSARDLPHRSFLGW